MDVGIRFVAFYDDEKDALNHEFELISSMPWLTNILQGGSGRVLTPAQIEAQRIERYTRVQHIRSKDDPSKRPQNWKNSHVSSSYAQYQLDRTLKQFQEYMHSIERELPHTKAQ